MLPKEPSIPIATAKKASVCLSNSCFCNVYQQPSSLEQPLFYRGAEGPLHSSHRGTTNRNACLYSNRAPDHTRIALRARKFLRSKTHEGKDSLCNCRTWSHRADSGAARVSACRKFRTGGVGYWKS